MFYTIYNTLFILLAPICPNSVNYLSSSICLMSYSAIKLAWLLNCLPKNSTRLQVLPRYTYIPAYIFPAQTHKFNVVLGDTHL